MIASDVYTKYRIPPWLQDHQFRVAAVGKLLSEAIPRANARDVVLVGLFHDMANILKFDLSPSGQLAPLFGDTAAYWQGVKDDYEKKYGTNEYAATVAIANEIGLPDSTIRLIEGMGFSKTETIRAEGPLELQIAAYADMRVGPYGVLPLRARIADLKVRASKRWAPETAQEQEARYDQSTAVFFDIEEMLFDGIALKPEDITDAAIASIIEELKQYEIS